MQPLIDILAQLNEDERNDFTSWFSSLGKKERESVASVLAQTTIDRVRTILSVPKEDRIALFLVQKNVFQRAFDSVNKPLSDLDRHLVESGALERSKEKHDQAWKKLKENWKNK